MLSVAEFARIRDSSAKSEFWRIRLRWAAAIALVLALVPAGLGAFALPNGLAPWACWAVFFAVLVAASVSGKLYGLHRARRRLHSEVGHILATVA